MHQLTRSMQPQINVESTATIYPDPILRITLYQQTIKTSHIIAHFQPTLPNPKLQTSTRRWDCEVELYLQLKATPQTRKCRPEEPGGGTHRRHHQSRRLLLLLSPPSLPHKPNGRGRGGAAGTGGRRRGTGGAADDLVKGRDGRLEGGGVNSRF